MNNPSRIPTNLRTLRIIEILGASERPMTPTEINAEIGLPKQTIHRLCSTLEQEGYLIKETNGKRLQPSTRLMGIASGILYASRMQIIRRQSLLRVANQVGETVNLAVPRSDGMMYLDRVETDWPFKIQLPIGSSVPFYCTATGKTFLASLSVSKRKSFVQGLNLKKLTDNTFVDKDEFLAELARVAKQGYARDNEEFMDGMIAVAAPVKDPNGRYIGSLAFHAPSQRLSIEDAVAQRNILFDEVPKLSESIFA